MIGTGEMISIFFALFDLTLNIVQWFYHYKEYREAINNKIIKTLLKYT